jgi:hypothetical protein
MVGLSFRIVYVDRATPFSPRKNLCIKKQITVGSQASYDLDVFFFHHAWVKVLPERLRGLLPSRAPVATDMTKNTI